MATAADFAVGVVAATGVADSVDAAAAGAPTEGMYCCRGGRHLHRLRRHHRRYFRGDGDGEPDGASEDVDDPSGCAPLGHSCHPP